MKKAIFVVVLSLFLGVMAEAGSINLYEGSGRISGGGIGEGRWIYFELSNDVTITQLGVVMEHDSTTDIFRWDIFSTNAVADFSSFSSVFETTATYELLALQEHNVDVSISLTEGFYALGFTNLDVINRRIDTVRYINQNLPNPTIDGNFRVTGAASSVLPDTPPVLGNNLLVPKFSVSIEGFTPPPPPSNVVPEPTTIALLGIGLAGLAGVALRRRFKRVRE